MGRQGSADVSVDAPLVFAGYGISAPEYQYDDFAGVNVAGKVVMVLNHEPQEGIRKAASWAGSIPSTPTTSGSPK